MQPSFHPNHTSNQPTAVVVDPDPISLLAIAGALHSHGYQCICARTAAAAIKTTEMGIQDLYVWDVAADAPGVLTALESIRQHPQHQETPAILIAESRWAGLEKKTESLPQATRCLFKPIDPNVLLAVADQTLWMPTLVESHRSKGSRPSRPGWVTL